MADAARRRGAFRTALIDAVAGIIRDQVAAVARRVEEVAAEIAREAAERRALGVSIGTVEREAARLSDTLSGDLASRLARLEDRAEKDAAALAGAAGAVDAIKAALPGLSRKGDPGEPGPPGVATLEGVTLELEPTKDERQFVMVLRTAGGVEARAPFRVPVPIYQGIHQTGIAYERGDTVTHDGALWIALAKTEARPGTPDGRGAWRLAVKSGRGGRDAP